MPELADADRPHLYSLELATARWDEMVRWYRDLLGLRSLIRIVEDGFAQLQAGATFLVLVARPEVPPASQRYTLVFEVEDIEAVAARLTAAPWAFETPQRSEEGFWQIKLADPDGNRVLIFAW